MISYYNELSELFLKKHNISKMNLHHKPYQRLVAAMPPINRCGNYSISNYARTKENITMEDILQLVKDAGI